MRNINCNALVFEVHDLTTNELLSNNLSFEDAPELVYAYQEFYPDHQIEVLCYRQSIAKPIRRTARQQFKHDWFDLLDHIMENLEH